LDRYERNKPAISPEDQERLAGCRVLVAGCGGLGGHIIEILARIGVGHITVVDGDKFIVSNLNRQLFSSEENIGRCKPLCAAERIAAVNPLVEIIPVCEPLSKDNADTLLADMNLAIDALDNGPSRLLLAHAARKAGIHLVSGAIDGWYGRVTVLRPGDDTDFLWEGPAGASSGNLSATAACVASIQASQAVKLLLNKGFALTKRLLEIDLLHCDFDIVEV